MRFWGIVLVVALTACTAKPPRYEGPEPTTPAAEPPAKGAFYGRVMHESGTGAPRATVGLRQLTTVEGVVAATSGGISCLLGGCGTMRHVEQTPEGTYSFPADMVRKADQTSVVATYPNGASAEVFVKDGEDPQRVPDIVLWEKEPSVRKLGTGVLVSWPGRPAGTKYTVYTKDGSQVSTTTLATSRFVPDWRVTGDLVVLATTDDFRHRTPARPAGITKPAQHPVTLNGRSCLEVRQQRRAVTSSDTIETSKDGTTFTTTRLPTPPWGVRNTVVGNDIRYVCGREVSLW